MKIYCKNFTLVFVVSTIRGGLKRVKKIFSIPPSMTDPPVLSTVLYMTLKKSEPTYILNIEKK